MHEEPTKGKVVEDPCHWDLNLTRNFSVRPKKLEKTIWVYFWLQTMIEFDFFLYRPSLKIYKTCDIME